MKHAGILAVPLVMVAVVLGAFALQHYTWTVSIQIYPLTNSITTGTLTTSGNSSGSENYGTHPTVAEAAVPAQDASTGDNATITLQRDLTVHFTVTDDDAAVLDNHFTELKINICIHERGKVNAAAADNLNLHVVEGGTGQTDIDNQTGTRSADNEWDPVITIEYTTRTVPETTTGNIVVNVSAGAYTTKYYTWTIPYEIAPT